jgi:putative transposase
MDNIDSDTLLITYKYRLYPNKKQESLLWSTLGVCKGVYNLGLSWSIEKRKEHISINRFDLINYVSTLKKTPEKQWINNIHSQVLQNVSDRIMKSYNMYFKTKNELPKFKSMFKYTSFTYPQSGFKIIDNNRKLKLSGIGPVKLVYHRPIVGTIKQCTIKHNKCNQWYACFIVEQTGKQFYKQPKETTNVVGIDLGIKEFLVMSDGKYISNPHIYKKSLKKIQKLSRSLSKKKKGSKNRGKARLKLAKAHLKVYNQRLDFQYKITNFLVNKYIVIGLEDISPMFMLKNHHLAQAAQDMAWGSFRGTLQYMSNKYQTIIGLVDPKNTSQLCSKCGEIVKKDLSVRIHRCSSCGLVLDRDLNAAINILNRIPEQYKTNMDIQIGQELSEYKPMESMPLFTDSNISEQVCSLK